MPDVTFVTAGDMRFASSRLRGYWPARSMGAQVMRLADMGHTLPDSRTIVWQKIAPLDAIEASPDRIHIWDVCDPLWWWQPEEARQAVALVDGITFSSTALQDDFWQWASSSVPQRTIPDRMDLSHYPLKRQQRPVSPVRFIWFGLAVNRVGLVAAWANLDRLRANGYQIELTVFDNSPQVQFMPGEGIPVYHVKWALDIENEVIANHDIAVLPPYPGPWGKVKSNNRDLTAWACGLPVTRGMDYPHMVQLVESAEMRTANIGDMTSWGNLQASADEWQSFIEYCANVRAVERV